MTASWREHAEERTMDDPRAGIPLKQESRAPVLVFTLLLCLTIGFLAGRLL